MLFMTRIPIEGEVDRLAYASWKNEGVRSKRAVYRGFGNSLANKDRFQLYDIVDPESSEVTPLREEINPKENYRLEAVVVDGPIGAEIQGVIFDARKVAKKKPKSKRPPRKKSTTSKK